MLKALLIADQQRLHALVAASLGVSGVQLTIISSLASGIEQAVATSPDLLFVQGRLSGLSIEIVTRHVASHVDQERTTSVIFVDPGEDPGAIAPNQICLDLALPDSTLENRIAALIKAAQPSATELPAAPSPSSPSADEFIPDASPALLTPHREAPLLPQEETARTDATSVPVHGNSIATRFEAELETELARRTEDPGPVAAPEVNGQKRPADGQTRVGQAEAAELAARSRRRIVTAVTVILLVMVAAVLATFYPASRTAAPPKGATPAKPAPPPATAQIPTTKPSAPAQKAVSASAGAASSPAAATRPPEPLRDPLPSFVPADRRDPAYATANPGWERYQDSKQEYKVFWEGGKLMAIQVIDKTGSGLSTPFFTKSMQELAGVRDYRLTGKEVKDNHLVKKGSLGKRGSIIIYKNKADSVLQAFVIHFEQDRNRRR